MKARHTHRQQVTRALPEGGFETITVQHNYVAAVPLNITERETNYLLQTGRAELTVPQLRTIRKATKRADWRARS